MNKKLAFLLSSILFIAPIAMTNAANSNDGDGTPIPIHEIDPKNNIPRSPVLVPISASYDGFLSCILVSFSYDLGEVDYELVNLSTSGTAYGTIDSDSGSQIIMMSGDAGYYSITFTLSSGTQYYGEFEITSI